MSNDSGDRDNFIPMSPGTHFLWNNLRHFDRQNLNVCNDDTIVSK
jgi:hypothetical protein